MELCDNGWSNKELVLERVSQDGMALEHASPELRDDGEVVLAAVRASVGAWAYVSSRLRYNRWVVLEVVKKNGLALRHVSESMRNDKVVVLEAIRGNVAALLYASSEIRELCKVGDAEFALENAIMLDRVKAQKERISTGLGGARVNGVNLVGKKI